MKGKIKFYNKAKGFGFITPEHEGRDIFFHHSAIQKGYDPQQNDEVEYDVMDGKRGVQASIVKLA